MAGAGAAGVAVRQDPDERGDHDDRRLRPPGRDPQGPRGLRRRLDERAEDAGWPRTPTTSGRAGTPAEVLEGTDLFIGLSGPGIIAAEDLERMNPDPFVFAMANPNPEVKPEEAAPYVRVMATGRSDYPNQINNVLAFPGHLPRRARRARAMITEEMKLAAANGIAARGRRRGAGRGLHHSDVLHSQSIVNRGLRKLDGR